MADKFVKGTLILTGAGLMVKIFASVNRILLSRLLGGEGIGLYQIAYPLYNFFVGLSAAGIPAAMSILISRRAARKEWGTAKRTFTLSLGFLILVGLLFALLAYMLVPQLIGHHLIKDSRAYLPMMAMIPAIALEVPLYGMRGYFQGFQEMVPPAASQIFEQFVRVVVMITLAFLLVPRGLAYGAAGAIFGAVPGAAAGIALLIYFYHRQQQKWHAEARELSCPGEVPTALSTARDLTLLAVPVACANLMVPLVNLIEIILVPDRLLVAGFTIAESTTALGYLSGMALPLVNMGTIPTNSLALSTVPAISEGKALGRKDIIADKTRQAFRFFILLNLPAAVGVAVLGTPLAKMLYNAGQAGPVVTALAPAIFLLGLHQVSAAVLQGLGYTKAPMINMLLSLIVKVGILWVLVANPLYHILGAAWATDLNLLTASILNLLFLYSKTRLSLPWKTLARTAVSSLLMGAAAWAAWGLLRPVCGGTAGTLLAVLAGAIVYALLIVVTGEIRISEVRNMIRRRRKHG
ncbi:MAG: polysaccharide biosynthesis protein [Acidaminococcus sp.]|jgi:stage V sporulation protein B|nr:polysaccharide biosynthesis protein [Acidaminococcus sp.]MCI2100593.1 polysaccharide biosynthesis protein [Acidaminococcus sp.]MCI2114914.1 polysaccharide biosynthesis protein [Acidaminococcus sp.]MCI2116940.1 polysaccharide biosynthesis protein [Acidaminococcus sp.]